MVLSDIAAFETIEVARRRPDPMELQVKEVTVDGTASQEAAKGRRRSRGKALSSGGLHIYGKTLRDPGGRHLGATLGPMAYPPNASAVRHPCPGPGRHSGPTRPKRPERAYMDILKNIT